VDPKGEVFDVDWIIVAQDRFEWRALWKRLTTHHVSLIVGNFISSRYTVSLRRRA